MGKKRGIKRVSTDLNTASVIFLLGEISTTDFQHANNLINTQPKAGGGGGLTYSGGVDELFNELKSTINKSPAKKAAYDASINKNGYANGIREFIRTEMNFTIAPADEAVFNHVANIIYAALHCEKVRQDPANYFDREGITDSLTAAYQPSALHANAVAYYTNVVTSTHVPAGTDHTKNIKALEKHTGLEAGTFSTTQQNQAFAENLVGSGSALASENLPDLVDNLEAAGRNVFAAFSNTYGILPKGAAAATAAAAAFDELNDGTFNNTALYDGVDSTNLNAGLAVNAGSGFAAVTSNRSRTSSYSSTEESRFAAEISSHAKAADLTSCVVNKDDTKLDQAEQDVDNDKNVDAFK
ncbi:MAG: hypothetical protein U0U67_12350 [Chitinophagales bacterium]